jgi:hypothetical protein
MKPIGPKGVDRPRSADATNGEESHLSDLVRELPERLEPSRDLWPGIAARLQDAPKRDGRVGWLHALLGGHPAPWIAAAAAVVLVVWIGSSYSPRRGVAPIGAPAATLVALDRLEAECSRARHMLVVLPNPAAPGVAALTENLSIVEAAMAETRRAYSDDPLNRDLITFVGSYRDRVARLQRSAVNTVAVNRLTLGTDSTREETWSPARTESSAALRPSFS